MDPFAMPDDQPRPNTSAQALPTMALDSLIGNSVKEALAKNFAKKVNAKKTQKSVQEETKQSINDVRNEFQI